uniref:hypothetical protein n=1 Tax=Thaumasiovibrio occultus TaxID=1891184 RepID=UPI000B35F545|nr:hypothetical protein [Thaumasiovibrio occultus]
MDEQFAQKVKTDVEREVNDLLTEVHSQVTTIKRSLEQECADQVKRNVDVPKARRQQLWALGIVTLAVALGVLLFWPAILALLS